MTVGQLLVAFTVGAALLALWSYLRWPGIAPGSMKAAFARIVLALVVLQAGLVALQLGVDAAPALAVAVVVGTVVPVLTYAFLASLWFMKLCADHMRGAF